MSEENKQRTDDESVELGSVLQLSPHTPTTREDTVEQPADGKGFISLDEVYENAGTEAIALLARNCAEYSKNNRLSPEGLSVLRISGTESLMPGYDRFNAMKGGESFVDSLKKGFIIVIKAIKALIIKVIDFIVTKIRTVLGFEKTEKELAIVAEQTKNAQGAVSRLLTKLAEGVDFKFDFNEFYGDLPDQVTSGEIFNIVKGKNRSSIEQIEQLNESRQLLAEANQVLMKSGAVARHATARYKEAVAELRAAAEKDGFNKSHIIKFRNDLESEVAGTLDVSEMTATTEKLLTTIYNLDLKGTGLDSTIKGQMTKLREEVGQSQPLVLDREITKRIMGLKASMTKIMEKSSSVKYDATEVQRLKDLIAVSDAELLEVISTKTGDTGLIQMGYTEYSNIISTYIQHCDLLSTVIVNIKKTIASLVNWTNKVDKLMTAYVAGDIAKIISVQGEVYEGKDAEFYHKESGKLNTVVDYDGLFIARHPKFAALVSVWRQHGASLYKKYNGAFREVNKLLAMIGVRTI